MNMAASSLTGSASPGCHCTADLYLSQWPGSADCQMKASADPYIYFLCPYSFQPQFKGLMSLELLEVPQGDLMMSS
ncbi:hypothetical protein ACOMHN_031874 [Nucella lapillus]